MATMTERKKNNREDPWESGDLSELCCFVNRSLSSSVVFELHFRADPRERMRLLPLRLRRAGARRVALKRSHVRTPARGITLGG